MPLGFPKNQVAKVAQQPAQAPYSLLSEPLHRMSATAGITGHIFLAINMEKGSISFPVEDKDKNRVKKTLTHANFLAACYNPGQYLKQALREKIYEKNMTERESLRKFFKKFLQVIYQFLHLRL